MSEYKINGWRVFIAIGFLVEMGSYFGVNHLLDRSDAEIITTGIDLLLFSLAFEKR
jgi:hypothetical protein